MGRAEANLPSIKARADRFKELLADKAVSQQDVDDAAGALKQVDKNGNVVERYAPTTKPEAIEKDILKIINS
jgi:glutathione peroxidase-family protein